MAEEKIIKCKYAGDPEDQYCSQCDGLHPIDDDGTPIVATNCGGYEPEEAKEQQSVKATPVTPADAREIGESAVETAQPNKVQAQGITTVIRAESGVSVEINGRWYKFMFSEERIVPEGCDIESEKQALWDSVNAQVDAQVEAVRN